MEPTAEARQQGERLCGCRICFEEGACSRARAIATAIAAKDAERLKAETELGTRIEGLKLLLQELRTERDNLKASDALTREILDAGPLAKTEEAAAGLVRAYKECVESRDNLKAEVERLEGEVERITRSISASATQVRQHGQIESLKAMLAEAHYCLLRVLPHLEQLAMPDSGASMIEARIHEWLSRPDVVEAVKEVKTL